MARRAGAQVPRRPAEKCSCIFGISAIGGQMAERGRRQLIRGGNSLGVNDFRKTGGLDFGADGVTVSNLIVQPGDFLR
jgi:hypothetical protein